MTLGKRLTQDLYLSYERSVAGAVGTMSIFYDVSRRFTVRARAGEENALDLIFTLQFRLSRSAGVAAHGSVDTIRACPAAIVQWIERAPPKR